MRLYKEHSQYTLYNDNMLNMLENIDKCSIDAIVTDPPYELGFMSKSWDSSGIAFQADTWAKCLDVLKPGGYMLAFGGSRTFHRIAVAIEDAGFEIRDTIMWLYGSGFPKSQNIEKAINKKDGVEFIEKEASGVGFMNTDNDGYHNTEHQLEQVGESSERAKQWSGWGTCLKPAYEPIIMARKPLDGTCVDNVLKHGVGAINIDGCRVGTEKVGGGTMPDLDYVGKEQEKQGNGHKMSFGQVSNAPRLKCEEHIGRFPANVVLTYDETDKEEVVSGFPKTGNGNNGQPYSYAGTEYNNKEKSMFNGDKPYAPSNFNDSGSASRYFYCAKASKKDRDEGLTKFENKVYGIGALRDGGRENTEARKNIHPTVKPVDLMQYLVRLVTPEGGAILDPFMGSGSTGKAVMYENKERNADYKFIGIELTDEYLPICEARIQAILDKPVQMRWL